MSDSDSADSDDGVRFKTANVRKKENSYDSSKFSGNKSRSPSPLRPIVGPVLPVHLIKQTIDAPKVEKKIVGPILPSDVVSHSLSMEGPSVKKKIVGPILPSESVAEGPSKAADKSIGPQLPAHLRRKVHEEENCASPQEAYVGPQLPPHLRQKLGSSNVHEKLEGPSLPPHPISQNKESEIDKQISIGPFLPPHLRDKLQQAQSSDEDDDIYGPVPDSQLKLSKAQIALEERALQLKLDKLLPPTQKLPDRDEWMLELPEVKANFGLGPRQFRAKPRPDLSDRSSWTDTPNNKTKKEEKIDLKKDVELKEMKRKDAEQEKISRKHKKKTDSLLEIHQSKLKKQKKDEKSTERRPFSRDIDLQVNKFDEAQKKAVLKKAQLLDDRFSSGQAKFL